MVKGTRARTTTRKRTTRSRHIERHDGESYPVYTPRELAALLGVQPDTLRKWRIQGIGPPFIRATRISIVYRKSAVEEWLARAETHVQITEPRKKRNHAPTQESNDTVP